MTRDKPDDFVAHGLDRGVCGVDFVKCVDFVAFGFDLDHLNPDQDKPVFIWGLSLGDLGAFFQGAVEGGTSVELRPWKNAVVIPVDPPPVPGPKERMPGPKECIVRDMFNRAQAYVTAATTQDPSPPPPPLLLSPPPQQQQHQRRE